MTQPSSTAPVRYDPRVERMAPDEDATAAQIDAEMQKIRDTTFADTGHAIRSVHAKGQGYLRGRLRVVERLPAELAQGLFASAGDYPVLMRFSTIPGDVLDDKVSVPRGLAVKVVGVSGTRLAGSEGDVTQDFLFVDAPAFNAPNPKKFLSSLEQLAPTTDKADGAKKALSATLQAVEKVVEAFGGKSGTLTAMGGHPETHVLGETYYTAAPIRYGDHIAKLSMEPASEALKALAGKKVDLDGQPNGLREAVREFCERNGGVWELKAQLCTDLAAMPVEDASVVWPEDQSPYLTVATIEFEPQTGWSEALAAAVDDGMMFSPWHGLAAHRPLGAVMRARKTAYENSAQFRAERNGQPIKEPRSLDDLPV